MDMTRQPMRAWRATSAALLGLLLALPALAQWQWVDATGRKVFSDTAPPASVPDKNILKRPGNLPVAPTPASVPVAPEQTAAVPATPAAEAPKLSGRDTELEARRKEAEAAEQAKKKAEQAKVAQARADNCERARKSRGILDSGVRVAATNAKGEREIMDDNTRANEKRRLDQVIQSDCSPMPQ